MLPGEHLVAGIDVGLAHGDTVAAVCGTVVVGEDLLLGVFDALLGLEVGQRDAYPESRERRGTAERGGLLDDKRLSAGLGRHKGAVRSGS